MTVIFAAALWGSLLWTGPCAGAEAEQESWADYSIIAQRNIFSRTRRASITVPPRTVEKAPTAVRSEQSYLVLRGVVKERDVFISFIEDSRTGEVKKVRQGEAIGGGMLSGVTLDYVSYSLADVDTRVEIGRTLEGNIPETSTFSYYSGSGFLTQPDQGESRQAVEPAQQTVVTGDEAKDILERLKERRKKELGE
jgi:hypothetical protein